MKTRDLAEDVWLVVVEDERDVEHNLPGYEKRFYFEDAVQAWTCWANATKAGFKAKSEKVRR